MSNVLLFCFGSRVTGHGPRSSRFIRYFLLIFLISLFFPQQIFAEVVERLDLKTSDGVKLHAVYRKVPDAKGTVILLPMLSKTVTSWRDTQKFLADNQYASVAVDLRGHGKSNSKKGREINWRIFKRKEFSKMTIDVETVFKYLTKKENLDPQTIFIMGASIGANTALSFAAEEPNLGGVLLLSPGFDYRGVKTLPAIERYGDRSIFFAVSQEDLSSAEAARHLAKLTPRRKIEEFEAAGHGTRMIKNEPYLLKSILNWLNEQTGAESGAE